MSGSSRRIGPGGRPDAGQRYAAAVSIGFSGYRARMIEAAPGTRDAAQELRPADGRWLAWHEAMSHGMLGREVRPLGDGVLLYDATDREPFWNRIAGVAWPADARRVRPPPDGDPGALRVDRPGPALLADAGLRRAGRPRRPPARRRIRGSRRRDADGARPGAGSTPIGTAARRSPGRPDVTVERLHRLGRRRGRGGARDRERARRARSTSSRTASARSRTRRSRGSAGTSSTRCSSGPTGSRRRRPGGRRSPAPAISRRSARGRRSGAAGWAGSPAPWRSHDAVAAGSRWTYLGVFEDNLVARRMYETSGSSRSAGLAGSPAPAGPAAAGRPDLPAWPVVARIWQTVDVERTVRGLGLPAEPIADDGGAGRARSSSSGRPRAAARDRRAVHGRPAGGRARASRRARRGYVRRAPGRHGRRTRRGPPSCGGRRGAFGRVEDGPFGPAVRCSPVPSPART